MAAAARRNRYIPFRRSEVVEMCARDSRLAEDQRAGFRRVARMLAALVHARYRDKLETLKVRYPAITEEIDDLLDAANYEPLGEADVARALAEQSVLKLRLSVDLDDFDEVLLRARGQRRHRETVSRWRGLRHDEIDVVDYDRVVVYARLKEASHFTAKEREDLAVAPGSTVLKLFGDIPRKDLEMLLPNIRVRLRLIDKIVIGVPAVIGGAVIAATKLATALVVVGLLFEFWFGLRDHQPDLDRTALFGVGAALVTFAAFVWRQVTKYKNRKIAFMKTLSQSLYHKSLDNGTGVFHQLLDDAEEADTKEALLAYHALLAAGAPLTPAETDRAVERWLADACAAPVDFDGGDAVRALVDLGLVSSHGGRLHPAEPDTAARALGRRWDAQFDAGAAVAGR